MMASTVYETEISAPINKQITFGGRTLVGTVGLRQLDNLVLKLCLCQSTGNEFGMESEEFFGFMGIDIQFLANLVINFLV